MKDDLYTEIVSIFYQEYSEYQNVIIIMRKICTLLDVLGRLEKNPSSTTRIFKIDLLVFISKISKLK